MAWEGQQGESFRVSDQPLSEHDEHAVTPLELFFDLVFVFALTQVTVLLTHDPTWVGLLRGVLVLSAVWWAWGGYTWLGSTLDVDEGGVRLAVLAAMGAMLVVALAVPRAFREDALLFGIAYLLVRVLHLTLYAGVAWHEPALLRAIRRVAPPALAGALLILGAAFVEDGARLALWILALLVEYLAPAVLGLEGWHVAPQHFAERYGLVVLIALGESIIAIGVGAGLTLTSGVVAGALLGFTVVAALWWLYFDVAAIFARRRFVEARGVDQARLALASYTYLHLPMVMGIVLFAFGLKTTLGDVGNPLEAVPAVALCLGVSVYLVALVAFLLRATGRVFRRRSMAAVLLAALIPGALHVPALAALGAVSAVSVLLVAYEAIARREYRRRLRHPEVSA